MKQLFNTSPPFYVGVGADKLSLVLQIYRARGTVQKKLYLRNYILGFPGGAVVKNLPANAGDTGSSPGLGRSHMPRSN